MVIRFHGKGRARFCLQHTRDRDGAPFEFWSDITLLSDQRVVHHGQVVADHVLRGSGVMIDYVDGDIERIYRKHEAGWLRVMPSDYQSPEERKRCSRYVITVHPA